MQTETVTLKQLGKEIAVTLCNGNISRLASFICRDPHLGEFYSGVAHHMGADNNLSCVSLRIPDDGPGQFAADIEGFLHSMGYEVNNELAPPKRLEQPA